MNNYSYGQCYFGRSYGYNKYGKKYTLQLAGPQILVNGHKIDIDTIEHQFNAHKQRNHVAPGKQAVHAYKEEAGR